MAAETPNLIMEPDELERHLGDDRFLIVDLGKAETYAQYHVPGAIHLDYPKIIKAAPPVMGLLPDAPELSQVLSAIGLTSDRHVVAYDDEGGGRASRLLWTLDVIGHQRYSLLNGGLHAWANEGHPLTAEPAQPSPSEYRANYRLDPIADRDYILGHLQDPSVVIWDARSPEEYTGTKAMATRGGHIPGAVNLDWIQTMDQQRNLRLKPDEQLIALLAEKGITKDKTVITHCQTHHRSAHSYMVLRHLGYPHIKGYPGSWSDWGNAADTPVEQ